MKRAGDGELASQGGSPPKLARGASDPGKIASSASDISIVKSRTKHVCSEYQWDELFQEASRLQGYRSMWYDGDEITLRIFIIAFEVFRSQRDDTIKKAQRLCGYVGFCLDSEVDKSKPFKVVNDVESLRAATPVPSQSTSTTISPRDSPSDEQINGRCDCVAGVTVYPNREDWIYMNFGAHLGEHLKIPSNIVCIPFHLLGQPTNDDKVNLIGIVHQVGLLVTNDGKSYWPIKIFGFTNSCLMLEIRIFAPSDTCYAPGTELMLEQHDVVVIVAASINETGVDTSDWGSFFVARHERRDVALKMAERVNAKGQALA